MTGIHIPADLAALDLTLSQVREILDNRKRLRTLQNRLEALPEKAKRLESDIAACQAREQELMDKAS
jgi:DNA-binding transcriptional MerR regulator